MPENECIYLEKRDDVRKANEGSKTMNVAPAAATSTQAFAEELSPANQGGSLDWKAQKAQQAEERKRANDLKKTEDRITEIEERISQIDEKMAEPDIATNSGKLNELTKERTALETELEELMEKWEALS